MMLDAKASTVRDQELPGLDVAMDEMRMTQLLIRHLTKTRAADGHFTCFDCRIVRVRHRRSTRAVIQYEWNWTADMKGSRHRLHVTGYLYRGNKAASVYRKMQTGDTLEVNGLSVPAVTYLPELGLLLLVYPHDRKLPALQHAVRCLPAAHQDTLCRRGILDGDAFSSPPTIDTVRYRAGLGATLRYRYSVACGPSAFYCKLYSSHEEAFATWQLLSDLRSMTEPTDFVCRPLSYCSTTHSILLNQAQGTPLDAMSDAYLLREGLRNLSVGLSNLQRARNAMLRTHSAECQRTNVERAASRLRMATPDLAPLIEHLRERALHVPTGPHVPSHRDLKLEHIFCRESGVTLIDWDSCALAHPMLDVSMLVTRFWARDVPSDAQGASNSYAEAARQFLHEYFAIVPPDWTEGYENYLAGSALEVALGFFGRQETNWKQTVRRLLLRTAHHLSGDNPSAEF